MVTLPTARAVTRPFSTVAIASSLVFQVTSPLVTFSGSTVAVSCRVSPMSIVASGLSRAMLVATIGLTVMAQVAVSSVPSAVVAVIVTLPTERAVTRPFSTVAIASSLVLQVTSPLVTFSGSTVAVSCRVSPMSIVASVLSRVMLVATIGLTVMAQVAVSSVPSAVVAVMVTLPTARAVTRPFSSTVAMVASLVLQVTSPLVTSAGRTVALSCSVSPTVIVASVLSRAILAALRMMLMLKMSVVL